MPFLAESGRSTVPDGAASISAARLAALFGVLLDDDISERGTLLHELAGKFGGLLDCDAVAIDTVSAGVVVSRARFGMDERAPGELADDDGVRSVLHAGQVMVYEDRSSLPPVLAARDLRTGIRVPFPEASVVLSLYRCRPAPFTPAETELVLVMGRALISMLRRGQLAGLAEHSGRVGACRTEREVLEVAVEGVLPLLVADACGVAIVEDGIARFTVLRGPDGDIDPRGFPVDQMAAASVLRDKKLLHTKDLRAVSADRASWPVRAALIAPVEVEGVIVALLGAYRCTSRDFTAEDEYVLTMLAGQVAAAMANTRLVQGAERRRSTAESLRGLSAALNGTLNVGEVAATGCSAMVQHSGADRAALLLLDEDQHRLLPVAVDDAGATHFLQAFHGPLGTITVGGSPALAQALLERRPALAPVGPQPSPGDARWLLVHPLTVHDRRVGAVLLEWDGLTRPTPPKVLNTIADMAATALEHAQLFERIERSGKQLAALHDVAVAINAEDDIASTLTRIVDSARQLTSAQVARIGLVNASGDRFTNVAVSGDHTSLLGSGDTLEKSVAAWVIRHAQCAWVPDTAAGVSEPPQAAAWIHDRSPGSAVAVPIHGRDGAAMGFLTLRHPQPYFLMRSCLSIVERFATEVGLAVENHRELEARRSLARQLREQASRDPLTGLTNRTHLLEVISNALTTAARSRRTRTLAVLFLDLDRFKTVNDSLGHAAGDELLCAVASRLRKAVRPGDMVGRLGGDEFVVLLEGLPRSTAVSEAEHVADRILRALAQPMTIRQRQVFVSASIGLTVASGTNRDADDLLRDADIAMYRAKAAGKAQIIAFEPSMSVGGLLDMESDLRQALDEHLLQVHYQVIVELSTGQPVGVEALARWQHPTLGAVPPVEFVALAEETGLVRRLDQWVLETALRDLGQLHERLPAMELNVNLSAVHLHEHELPARIANALQASGVRPELLTLEITETAAMWDPSRTLVSLTALQALGIGVVLDDFGTGYSNFGQLKRFPLRGLKIDQTFVEHLDVDQQDAAIVAALITLSDSLGLGVIAEGVETREQQLRLLELGCRRGQGYLFSRPLPLVELLELLSATNQRGSAVR